MPRLALLAMTGAVPPDPPLLLLDPLELDPELLPPELPLLEPPDLPPLDPLELLLDPPELLPDPLLPLPEPLEPPDPLVRLEPEVEPWPELSPLLPPPQALRISAMAATSNPLQTNDVFFM
jgi:hypothetical protein